MFSLAVPVIGINLLTTLMLAVDAALCGRLADSENVRLRGYAARFGLLVGTVALVARAHGAGASARVCELMTVLALVIIVAAESLVEIFDVAPGSELSI